MKLDVHAHFDSADSQELKAFVQQCEALETRVCVCSGGPRTDRGCADNDFVIQALRPYGDVLVPFAFVDLWDQVEDGGVARLAEMGFRGLKCITPYYPYDHDLYMPVYEAAEKLGLPVLFHTGVFRPNQTDVTTRRPMVANMRPLCADRIARSFPNLKIILAHLGTQLFRQEAASLVRLHPNVYADLAGSGNWMGVQPQELAALLGNPVREVDASFAGFRKLLLGSDAYVSVPAILREGQEWYLRTLQRVGVPEDVLAGIMGETVAAWLSE